MATRRRDWSPPVFVAVLATLLIGLPISSHSQQSGGTVYFTRGEQPVWRDSTSVQECEQATPPDRVAECSEASYTGPPAGTSAQVITKSCPYEMLGIRITSGSMVGRDGCVNGDYLAPAP